MIWTIQKLIEWGKDYLNKKNIESPRLNIELIICHALNLRRIQLYTNYDKPLLDKELIKIKKLLKRRVNREPIQYIIGETQFLDLNIICDKRALIPRPETEELVSIIISRNKTKNIENILDLGTGTGCIALALKKYFPHAKVTGLDISCDAISLARENSIYNSLDVQFIDVDMFDFTSNEKYDIIVSNPPYVAFDEMNTMEPELIYEPQIALTDYSDGISFYKKIVTKYLFNLSYAGEMYFELGYNSFLLLNNFLKGKNHELIHDMNQKNRFLVFKNC